MELHWGMGIGTSTVTENPPAPASWFTVMYKFYPYNTDIETQVYFVVSVKWKKNLFT